MNDNMSLKMVFDTEKSPKSLVFYEEVLPEDSFRVFYP